MCLRQLITLALYSGRKEGKERRRVHTEDEERGEGKRREEREMFVFRLIFLYPVY